MRNIGLESVTDCDVIFEYGNSVIFCGKNPWLFRKDGSFVAKYKSIRNAYNMVFLPGNCAFVEGGLDRSYHYISLDTGEVLWTHPQKGRRDTTPSLLAVTADGEVVYYVYSIKRLIHVDRLVPSEKCCTTYTIPFCRGATYHCYCDEQENLCLLQTFLPKKEDDESQSFRINGILRWNPDDQVPIWKHQWTEPIGSWNLVRVCNDEYVLMANLNVLCLKTGEIFSLLENQTDMPPIFGGYTVQAYDSERQYLSIGFTYSCSNIVIDCKSRKLAAHYVPFSREHVSGCLIDGEFWIGSDDGVVKRQFPHMDPFPRKM